MKKFNRTKLLCWKKLPCGVMDKFTVIVDRNEYAAAKQKYKAMGYEVEEL